jgi:hypothetical protein
VAYGNKKEIIIIIIIFFPPITGHEGPKGE